MDIVYVSSVLNSRFVELRKKIGKSHKLKHYKIDKRSKNIILGLFNTIIENYRNSLIISEGVSGYFTYYATSIHGKCDCIIINPKFFNKSGGLVVPEDDLYKHYKSEKKVILLSEDNPNTPNTIKFLDSNGIKYSIVPGENVNTDVLMGIIREKFSTKRRKKTKNGVIEPRIPGSPTIKLGDQNDVYKI